MNQITVIGAGTMGLKIAQLFAQYNYKVVLIDSNESVVEEAKLNIEKQLVLLKDYDFISHSNINETLQNITISTNLGDSKHSWMIVEAIPEIKQLKIDLFQSLELICDENVIFATNTSGISINSIGNELKHPERFIGTHFFSPADVIPLVEIIRGYKTSDEVVKKIMQFYQKLDKYPVILKKDVPGFIGNRIQHAMAREAISLLEEGIATAEEIDAVVRWGLGPRLLFTGPLEQRDINGLDVHYYIASYLYKELENRTEPSNLLTEKFENGELGLKTGKGFYDWDADEKQSVNHTKTIQVMQILKNIKSIDQIQKEGKIREQ